MPQYKVEARFHLVCCEEAVAARCAFERMEADPNLEIRLAEIVSGAIHKPAVTVVRASCFEEGEPAPAAPHADWDKTYRIETSFEVDGADIQSAARNAFETMASDPEFRIDVAEQVSGAVYKRSLNFTREAVYDVGELPSLTLR